MFSKDTYVSRRETLKKKVGKGLLLFLGNDESGANYEDNTLLSYIISDCPTQDSTQSSTSIMTAK